MAFDLPLRDNGAGTFDLTLAVSGGTNAPAGNAAVTVTAETPTTKVNANATEATGAVAAFDASISIKVNPSSADGIAAALDATVTTTAATTATPTEAAATVAAYDATVLVRANASEAAVGVQANNADVDTSNVYVGGNTGNNTAPTVTLSSSIIPGQVIFIGLMLNNTNVVTTEPAGLETLDAVAPTGGGQGHFALYRIVADGSTAGSVLTWALSATRNWAIAYIAQSGGEQDQTSFPNVFESISDTVTPTNTFAMPSGTSTKEGYAIEFFGVKGDGTAIASTTPAGGWDKKRDSFSAAGFGSNISIATKSGNPVAPATYGGNNWTTDQNAASSFRYVIVLAKAEGVSAAIGAVEAFDPTIEIRAYPAEAPVQADALFDPTGGTVSLIIAADNPIFVGVTAYDATVTTAIVTNAPAAEATGSVVANDPTILISPNALEATVAGAAQDAAASVKAAPSEAAVTGAAFDPTVATQSFTTAPATEAVGTVTAYDATVGIRVNPAEAGATVTAPDSTIPTGAQGGLAAATVAAFDPTVSITFTGLEAVVAANSYDALLRIGGVAGLAAVGVTSEAATAMISAMPSEATVSGASLGPTGIRIISFAEAAEAYGFALSPLAGVPVSMDDVWGLLI